MYFWTENLFSYIKKWVSETVYCPLIFSRVFIPVSNDIYYDNDLLQVNWALEMRNCQILLSWLDHKKMSRLEQL